MANTTGGVRKALDISFLGETREESWMLYGDVEIKGLDVEASAYPVLILGVFANGFGP